MTTIHRRNFLDRTGKLAMGLAASAVAQPIARQAKATSANEKVTLAFIGVGGRGGYLAQKFAARGDCNIAYLCDVDESRVGPQVQPVETLLGRRPKVESDFRRALDDQSVDAVVIATPDHWHAPATIWACRAEKDVYVEKPPSHSCWEGRKMVEAARRYKRIVQAGFQNRSAPYCIEAKKYIEAGKLGAIHLCRIFNQKPPWGDCPVVPDSATPAGLNWDMWNGPAPEHDYNSSMHQCWNHQWCYSGGDIANDASHQIDLARWLLGVEQPRTVYSTGGRFDAQSAAQTPDTQIALYDYDKLLVSFELTLFAPYMIKEDQYVRDNDLFPYWMQNGTRIEIFGTEGMMIMGRHGGGWQVFVRQNDRQPVVKDQMYGRFPDPEHQQNFIDCIRSRKEPNAEIEKAHLSALLIHYANISYRLGGRKLTINPETESFVGDDEANKMLKREYRSPWMIPEVV